MKENKFVMGEEETDKPLATATTVTSSPQQHTKRPTRHHVKRRSSGRVHVAKLAPMARVNSTSAHTDSEADFDSAQQERPMMRRSQSQRSLHRMSFDNSRKSFTCLAPTNPKTGLKKPIDKEDSEPAKDTNSTSNLPRIASTSTARINPASLSFSKGIAAPIEQTFNAVANTLVIPKSTVIHSKFITPKSKNDQKQQQHTQQEQRQLLYSQFIASTSSSYEEPSHVRAIQDSNPSHSKRDSPLNITATTPSPRNIVHIRNSSSSLPSRTQQKLNLQKQQSMVEDETSPIHPRNMQRLNKELEVVRREYKCIKRHQDPMQTSLLRCLENLDRKDTQSNHSSTITNEPSYMEQREIVHRYHHLKIMALSNSSKAQQNHINTKECQQQCQQQEGGLFGNAVAFIDRILSNNYGSQH